MGDARSQRTRLALFIALDDLLAERIYSEISVTDLALRAKVGRQTFYRHFDSVDAMLKDRLLTSLADQMASAKGDFAEPGSVDWFQHVTQGSFERVAAQPRISRVILRGEAGADALDLFRQQIIRLWASAPTNSPLTKAAPELRPYVASFHAGAITAMLLHWIDAGCSPDAKTMSDLFTTLSLGDRLA